MARIASHTLKAAAWGLLFAAVLAALIVVGSRNLNHFDAALVGCEAVLHAASQDLPCLAELGYRPRRLFDTELAGRLLGYPRVGLGVLVETVLGFSLEKGHAAADWSTRPLPTEWLRYAALDVEVARQPSEPRHLADERDQHADHDEHEPQDDERTPDVAHRGYLSNSVPCPATGAAGGCLPR